MKYCTGMSLTILSGTLAGDEGLTPPGRVRLVRVAADGSAVFGGLA